MLSPSQVASDGRREERRWSRRFHQVVAREIPRGTEECDVGEFFPNTSMIVDNNKCVFVKQSLSRHYPIQDTS
jgi:hypothetical protein